MGRKWDDMSKWTNAMYPAEATTVYVMVFGINPYSGAAWIEYNTKRPILGVAPHYYRFAHQITAQSPKIALFVSNLCWRDTLPKPYLDWLANTGYQMYLEKVTIND